MRLRVLVPSCVVSILVSVFIAQTTRESAMSPNPVVTCVSMVPEQTTDGAVEGPTVDPAARLAGADAGWWSKVSQQMEREEYNASVTTEGLQAPNRAHNLRTYFRNDAIEVVPRGGDAPWRFTWQTTRWGRSGNLIVPAPATSGAKADGPRVTYTREGLTEWYENKREGLEQGFTVNEHLAGTGPLRICGRAGEGLRAEYRTEGGAVDFLDQNGVRVLRYGGLSVKDAKGAEVPSRLTLLDNEIALLIDDAEALYPLTVDPLLTSPSWTVESDQAESDFSSSLGTAGDVNGDGYSDVIVAAPYYDHGQTDEGRVFVYHGSPGGLALSAAWTAEGNQASAHFGACVGTAGDVNGDGYSDVIVGASSYDNGQTDEGRAYVYHGSATGLAVSEAWTAESDQVSAHFGARVGTAGDVNGDGYSDVIVSADYYDNGQTDEGRVYVYHGSSGGLATSPAWTAESDQAGAKLGFSAGTAGDVNGDGYSDVIAGAPYYDNGQTDEGRAYVYHGSPAGLATSPAWTAESDQVNAYFGLAGGMAGDVNGDGYSDVIVGSPAYDNGQTDEGRSYVYQGSSGGLSTSPAWTAECDQTNARFGGAIGTAGDVNGDGYADVIVGAVFYDNGQTDEGGAFVYQGSSGGLATSPGWTGECDQENAHFGGSVATAGDVNGDGYSDVLVGAYSYTHDQTHEGRAYAYHGSPAGVATSAAWTAESDQASAYFGYSIGTAGDVNGDGYSDVIVGADEYDNGQTDEGRAYVYLGSPGGLATSAAWTAEGDQASVYFGYSVGTAGDVNGDGYSDLIVGAFRYGNGQTNEGRAYVYHGSPEGLTAGPAWTAESDQENAQFGCAVGTAGDVNGDGYADVIVGARYYSSGQPNAGRVYVYYGSSAGLATSAAWTAEGDQAMDWFGSSVGTAGDVNGDGYSDVIVGATYHDNGQTDEGRAYVYQGSSGGLAASPAWTTESDQVEAYFGCSVGTAGDVNGDGYADVIVGAYHYDNGDVNEGRAYVYHGSSGGLAASPAWTAEGDKYEASFGYSVRTAGDVNGDAYSDVIVGAPFYNNGQPSEGRTYMYQGSSGGLAASAAWTAESDQATAQFGWSVGAAGDVNGDGYSDVIVGAVSYTNGQTYEGRAFVYYGNGGDGLDRVPGQARTRDTAPIAILGQSDSEAAFRLKALGRTPGGRGNVRLQYEVKPAGTQFNGTNLVTGPASSTGAPGGGGSAVALSELASDLTASTLYHWRLRILTDSPFFPRSRWLWLPDNSVTEADVRTCAFSGLPNEWNALSSPLLRPGAPNPFGDATELVYNLPERGGIRLAVYDPAGREIAVAVDREEAAGLHVARWDGRDARGELAPAGVYFVRLEFRSHLESRRLVLVR